MREENDVAVKNRGLEVKEEEKEKLLPSRLLVYSCIGVPCKPSLKLKPD